MSMDKVESVDINQRVLGRLLNYGGVTVLGIGEGGALDTIASPLSFAMPSPHDQPLPRPWPYSRTPAPEVLRYGFDRRPHRSREVFKMSDEWWDHKGKMAPIHQIDPVRLAYIRDAACRQFERRRPELPSGLRILDIGSARGGVRADHPAGRAGDRRSIRRRPTSRRRGCMPTRGLCHRLPCHDRGSDGGASGSTWCWRWR